MTSPTHHDTTHSNATSTTPPPARVRTSGPDTIGIPLPFLGTIRLSRPELAYVGGIAALSAFGLLEWPVALVIGAGHVLAADRSSQTVQDLGEAMTAA